jgi:hypothetical protein
MKRKENESNLLLNIVLCIIVPVISNSDNKLNLQNISVTLTFEEGRGSWTRQNVVMR